ncbi:transmembrane protein 255A isoform X1 [Pleurodeles waltl]|uniref:transmembrane protein 255A isoform X1 n=1 Tax=Pleurodeles waltl TaxID=8319 RepID=UPI003709C23F
MHRPLTQQQPHANGITTVPDSTGSFRRRRRNSLFVTVSLLIVSMLILTVGLAATTRTQNVTVGGYYPGAILGFGSFLGIIGANLIENKRQMLVASIVFISFGVIAAFCCAIVDGVFASKHLDLRPLYEGKCDYFPKGAAYTEQTTEVSCPLSTGPTCTLQVKSNTCYCCDLYNCGSRSGSSSQYYEYIDVNNCQDVIHLYHLLWSATILNIVGLFLGIITAAVLGGFTDAAPGLSTISCTPETPRPTVSYNSSPPVPAYNTYYHSTPHLPPYTAYDLQHSSVYPVSTPSGLSDDPQAPSQPASSFMWSSSAPPRYSPPHFPPDEKPPPYTP